MLILNDVQSKLNKSRMVEECCPSDVDEISEKIINAQQKRFSLCPAGSLHSMGGQQFLEGGVSLSSKNLKKIGPLNEDSSSVWLQSGVMWTELVPWLQSVQKTSPTGLSIIQKQTGADKLTLGGAIASNIHGRGLNRRPIIEDIKSFYLTTALGERILCSRSQNTELFGLVIGGYGLFGFVDSIELSLIERKVLVRHVQELSVSEVMSAFQDSVDSGAIYGDFQYMTDETSPDFLERGVMSVYSQSKNPGEIQENQIGLSNEDWMKLYVLAHTDKKEAYKAYVDHYLQTNGQLYWSDDHQFSPYLPEAGTQLVKAMGWTNYVSLMITELYVPRHNFEPFMKSAKVSLINSGANTVYGTVRLIEAENESELRWARENYACVIFNLLVEHTAEGINKAIIQFRSLIDCALNQSGSYYLTYHRWPTKNQVEEAYPNFRKFLALKEHYDKNAIFDSDWHRHYVEMFK